MRTLRFAQLLLLTGATLSLSGCAALQMVSQNVFLMSPDQEAQLGRQLAVEIEKKYPVYRDDPEATAYVESLGRRLVQAAPPCAQQFRFQLVKSDEVNAFAIPGGSCYVQVGLLREADAEAELAAVVAHEIGHVTARHGAKGLSSSRFYGGIADVFLGQTDAGAAKGQQANEMAKLAASIAESQVLLQHSRQDELEADAISIATLPRAGINPKGLVDFFGKLESAKAQTPGRFERLFSALVSTHPPTAERVALARQRIEQLGPPSPNWSDDSTSFRRIKRRYPPRGN